MTDEYKFRITGKDATKRAFQAIQRNLVAVRGAINSTHVQVGLLAGAAGLGALVARSLSVNDSLAKTADRVNATTEGLAALRYQTELNGESAATLDKSLEKMRRSVGEADQGVGEAKDAFKLLGIEMDGIRDLKADEQFELIGTAIGNLSDVNQKAAISADIFGKSGIKLLNVFNQGEEGFRTSREQAERLGIAMSRVDAAKIEDANDSMVRSRLAIEGIGNRVTVQLAPVISALSDQFVNAATSGDNMADVVETGFKTGANIVGTFADGIRGVQVLLKGAEVAALGFGGAFVGGVKFIAEGAVNLGNIIKDGVLSPIRGLLEMAANLPIVGEQARQAIASIDEAMASDFKPPAGLDAMFTTLTEGLSSAKAELHSMMMEDLPSAVIDQKLTEILAIAEEKAAAAADRIALRAGVGTDSTEGDDPREQGRIQERLDRLNESYSTEYDMLLLKLTNEKALLVEARNQKLLDEQEFQESSLRATKKYEDAKAGLEKKEADAKKAIMAGNLKTIAQVAGSANKKLFAGQKAASLAHAAVTLPAAIIKSYHNAGGYPLGIPAAIAMAATGAKNIAAIKSTSFGGGGSGASAGSGGGAIGGGGSSSPGSAIGGSLGRSFDEESVGDQSGKQVVIQIIGGDIFTQDSEQFTDKIVSAVQKYTDADGILFLNNSAQAVELA